MPTPLERLAATVLYEALRSKIGIVVLTDDPDRAKTTLYRFRRQLNDPELMCLKIYISPIRGNEIWIIKTNMQES